MALVDRLEPKSSDTILFVVLAWVVVMIGVSQVSGTSMTRLELVVGSVVVMGWASWAIHHQLGRHGQGQRSRGR